PDRAVGRDNFAIALSAPQRALLYTLFGLAPYLLILLMVALGLLPPLALLALLTLALFVPVVRDLRGDSQERIDQLIPAMGKNVALTLATPLLLAVGMSLERLL
ncbi:MAG: prenyltransferase, partial [Gammaproteobacteria bacterium]|nr:prenyltransferase [Gammaproteobacteria bacterium]